MKKIKQIHTAMNAPMGYLVTYRALPTHSVDHIDPFLFLNHHGPQDFPPNNNGLPFGPHPHRGFMTLTFVIDGDVVHKDSTGGSSKIVKGGVQWMTAGSGLIHSEVSSPEFIEKGGREEILQLWMNLPSHLKMTAPKYRGFEYDELTHFDLDNGQVKVNLISGEWAGHKGPMDSITNLFMTSVELQADGKFEIDVVESRNVFFYVVRGKVIVNGQQAQMLNLVEFTNEGSTITVEALEDSIILFGHGEPYNERIVAHGPFVMNTEGQIAEAMHDYQTGKMGVWSE